MKSVVRRSRYVHADETGQRILDTGTWVGPTVLEVTAEGYPTYDRSTSRTVLTNKGQRFRCTDKRYGETGVEVLDLLRGPDHVEYTVRLTYGGGIRIVPGEAHMLPGGDISITPSRTDTSLSRTLMFRYMFVYKNGALHYTVKDDVFNLVEQGKLTRKR